MAQYKKPLFASLMLLALGYLLAMFLLADLTLLKHVLMDFKHLCHHHPVLGYAIYSTALCAVLFSGLPVASMIMLLAGIIFSFWEAALIITVCRLGVAVCAFILARSYFGGRSKKYEKKPKFVKKLENHPKWALFLMRLSPLPDSMVNYTMGAAPVSASQYALVSLLGMIPFTLAAIMIGEHLGNLRNLIHYIS